MERCLLQIQRLFLKGVDPSVPLSSTLLQVHPEAVVEEASFFGNREFFLLAFFCGEVRSKYLLGIDVEWFATG